MKLLINSTSTKWIEKPEGEKQVHPVRSRKRERQTVGNFKSVIAERIIKKKGNAAKWKKENEGMCPIKTEA